MNERTRNAIVGLTALIGICGLGYLILIFGEIPQAFTDTYPIQIHVDDASGVVTGTRVRLNGIDIGFVEHIKLKQRTYEGVVLHCLIQADRKIPTNSTPIIAAGLIGGSATLNISTFAPPQGQEETFLAMDGSAMIQGMQSNLGKEITEIAQRIEVELTEQLKHFGTVSEKIIALSDEYLTTGKRVNEMLEARSIDDVNAGKAEGNLRTMIVRADARMAELRETIERINGFVSEDMQKQVEGTLADTRQTFNTARQTLDAANERIDQLGERFVTVAEDLSKTLASAQMLLDDARAGKGTAGRLIQDPALYNNFNATTKELRDLLIEARLLIQKWKAEGLPIQF